MVFQCNGCESSFQEKKNLQQHMRIRHGFKKYKCSHCNFHSDDRTSVLRHEKAIHENELFKCDQCEYTANDKSNLRSHIRSKHMEKNLKCDECNFVTDRKDLMNRHVHAKHILKKCNECEYTTLSKHDMKKHKNNQHEPDNFQEKSAFNKLMYEKTYTVRGVHDPLSSLQAYKSKIRNDINNYIDEKEGVKWHIGMKVSMYKMDKEGNILEQVTPGFTSNPTISSNLMNFELLYDEHHDKIINDFVSFNANGSGWILKRVYSISLHMMQYSIGGAIDEDSNDSDDVSIYSSE